VSSESLSLHAKGSPERWQDSVPDEEALAQRYSRALGLLQWLKDFIRRGVSDALTRAQTDIRTLAPERVNGFVDSIYEAAFDILQTLAEAMAES
jgi:hypothetical protein